MDSNDFLKNLTEKIGPFPGYVYVLAGAGGIWYYRKKHPSTATSTATVDPSTAPAAPSASFSDQSATPLENSSAASQLYQTSPFTQDQISQALDAINTGSSVSSNLQPVVDQLTALTQGQNAFYSAILAQSGNSTQDNPPAPGVTNNPNVPPPSPYQPPAPPSSDPSPYFVAAPPGTFNNSGPQIPPYGPPTNTPVPGPSLALAGGGARGD